MSRITLAIPQRRIIGIPTIYKAQPRNVRDLNNGVMCCEQAEKEYREQVQEREVLIDIEEFVRGCSECIHCSAVADSYGYLVVKGTHAGEYIDVRFIWIDEKPLEEI